MKPTVLSVIMVSIMMGAILLSGTIIATSDTIDDFTVSIQSGQSTSLTSLDTDFGILVPGSVDNTISSSFSLINVGNLDASVSATFTTNNATSGIYGMDNTTYGAIGGANFSMNLTGQTATNLDSTASDTDFSASHNVVADNVSDVWDVQLDVPAGQSTAIYTGVIELTFMNI